MPTEALNVPAGYRSGFVGLIGKPNVGKSTILNLLLGRKVSIVSPRPQTTRQRVLGILTKDDAQVIFVDTPGWHKPEDPLGRHLISVAKGVIEEVDILVAVLDATSGIEIEDEWVFNEVRQRKRPALAVINKADAVKKPSLLPFLEQLAALKLFDDQIPVSALKHENLDVLLKEIIRRLPEGPRWYAPGQVTDQTSEQIIRELIREQVFNAVRQEVPYAVAIRLDAMEDKPRVTVIQATILVEREGQKAIMIGKRGQMLKEIGKAARLELERELGRRIYLELWVKVEKDWRRKMSVLRELGYHY